MRNYLIEILLSVIALFLFIITLIIAPEWLREIIAASTFVIFLILIFGLYCWAIFRFVSRLEYTIYNNSSLITRIFMTFLFLIISLTILLVFYDAYKNY